MKPPEDGGKYGAHLYLACNEDGDDRTSPFVLDLSNTFLWLTVLYCLHFHFSLIASSFEGAGE